MSKEEHKVNWFELSDLIPFRGYFTGLNRVSQKPYEGIKDSSVHSKKIVTYALTSAAYHFAIPSYFARDAVEKIAPYIEHYISTF
jgi:hypothetical protein